MIVGIDTDFLVRASGPSHTGHQAVIQLRDQYVDEGNTFAIAPQVISEFVHVVTDARRFSLPLAMENALEIGSFWWNSANVCQVTTGADALTLFNAWMIEHRLGRKRILDTMLAATYAADGIGDLISGNARDYRIFGQFKIIEI